MKKEISLLIDSHHGIYSGQILAEQYGAHLQVSEEDKNILKSGPDHEDYIETWADMEGETLVDDNGERYFIWTNEGDTWAVPEGWEWSDEEDTYIEPASEPEGLILRTIIDIAFADLVTSYKDRQKAIDTIFARIESLKLGDWITEDTGRKYELTYIPKDRNHTINLQNTGK